MSGLLGRIRRLEAKAKPGARFITADICPDGRHVWYEDGIEHEGDLPDDLGDMAPGSWVIRFYSNVNARKL